MNPRSAPTGWPRRVPLGDLSLYVDVVGQGDPLVLMHGGPSADLWTLGAFRPCADQATLVFYDHRCNGRSTGVPVSTMTWGNLTADAEALREHLGFEKWSVLGHSFGGQVALEYTLRHPDRVSRLVLLDTGADALWAREKAPELLARRGYSPARVELVRRWFHGDFAPREYFPIFARISGAYMAGSGWRAAARLMAEGGWRSRMRPEALIYAGRHLMDGWSVVNRLSEITAPTLVIAGREDFIFPPTCQEQLAQGIPGAQLVLVDKAGHNPQDEQPAVVLPALRAFLSQPLPAG
ncbi:MAG: alpha/beta hydrolase [Micrococcales bacterium]|nr:alpha/beta hydrolase [Micrococcales bacterium]